jgi:hypothetical protein
VITLDEPIAFDSTKSSWDYRCYDMFLRVSAAEKFLKEANAKYGVVGIVVYTPNDPIMKQANGCHGCGNYPFVLLQEGWQEGGSGNYILELADLAEHRHGGRYAYS